MVRYTFPVRLFHSLLHAGLSRRYPGRTAHPTRQSRWIFAGRKETKIWKDTAAERGKTSYYYVRGEQADGVLVWVSPMWIRYQ